MPENVKKVFTQKIKNFDIFDYTSTLRKGPQIILLSLCMLRGKSFDCNKMLHFLIKIHFNNILILKKIEIFSYLICYIFCKF